MKKFSVIIEYISRFLGYISAAMILSAVLITCQMIFVRFVLNESTVWQTEVVVFLSIAATLLGLPYVQVLKGHVNVDLVPLMLSPSKRKVLLFISSTVSIIVMLIMFYFSYELLHFAYERNWTTESVNAIPLWIPYSALPIGFGVYALQMFSDMYRQCLNSQSMASHNLTNEEEEG